MDLVSCLECRPWKCRPGYFSTLCLPLLPAKRVMAGIWRRCCLARWLPLMGKLLGQTTPSAAAPWGFSLLPPARQMRWQAQCVFFPEAHHDSVQAPGENRHCGVLFDNLLQPPPPTDQSTPPPVKKAIVVEGARNSLPRVPKSLALALCLK